METVSINPWKYSPERNNKKKSIQAKSVMTCCLVAPPWYVSSIYWRMEIGMMQNQEESGSLRYRL